MSKGLRVLGHPLHAVLSDFPLALLGTSLLWDVTGCWRTETVWWAISFWNIAAGLAIALVTAMAGAADYAAIGQGDRAQKLATNHMVLMLLAVSLYAASLLVRGGPTPPVGLSRAAAMALEGVGLILLVAGGWCGGHLVFHYGIGRDTNEER
ncbi:MAG TPA: DUF2231 domain-containing protein [Blastocatellia bacterium]|nr:DUF2231 domain-containing protein [Blastocatellia bacterium]